MEIKKKNNLRPSFKRLVKNSLWYFDGCWKIVSVNKNLKQLLCIRSMNEKKKGKIYLLNEGI